MCETLGKNLRFFGVIFVLKNLRIFVVMVDYCFDMNWYFAEVGGTNHEVGTKADRVFLVHKLLRLCMWNYHKWLSYLS